MASHNALRILDSKEPQDQEAIKSLDLPQIDQFIPEKHQAAFEELLNLLNREFGGQSIERDFSLVRGLDYYNGTCFEVKIDDSNISSVQS